MGDEDWQRACASNFRHPPSSNDIDAAQNLAGTIRRNNRGLRFVFRERTADYDLLHPVYRWEGFEPNSMGNRRNPYVDVLENGFRARPQQDAYGDNVYYNLENHVTEGGRIIDFTPRIHHAFISTTLSSTWSPPAYDSDPGRLIRYAYRYEIYAPGGIQVSATYAESLQVYRFPDQEEVCFLRGIAPRFIRSAQAFQIIGGPSPSPSPSPSETIMVRMNTDIILNSNFNPVPAHLHIYNPIISYEDDGQRCLPLNQRYFPPRGQERRKREVSTSISAIDWYAIEVGNDESYINAAFRSSRKNEAYLFMKNEYVLLKYAPSSTNDTVLNGPKRICEGFPSLRNTAFAEYGIDCAFGSHDGNEAFIFAGNLCAQIDYAPHTTDDKIVKGPMTITKMFPFFKDTEFESGIDAAFESPIATEAYLFKGKKFARINYVHPHLISIHGGFASLKGSIFESGIEAAFSSHRTTEAYIFKGDYYARITFNFESDTTDYWIIDGVKKILPNWPILRGILPRKNRGLDFHSHTDQPDPDPRHVDLK